MSDHSAEKDVPEWVVETREEWGVTHDLTVGEPSKWNYPLDAMRYAKANNMTVVRRNVTTKTLVTEWEPVGGDKTCGCDWYASPPNIACPVHRETTVFPPGGPDA